MELHKFMDIVGSDKHIARLILDGEIDDVCAKLPGNHIDRVWNYHVEFSRHLRGKHDWLVDLGKEAIEKYGNDRKQVALELVPHLHENDRMFMFKALDGRNVHETLVDFLKRKVRTDKLYEETWNWLKAY